MSVTKNQAAARAIQWIKNHRVPGSGILTHHKHTVASQEVTGYIIETLFHVGEKELAKDLARWEASVQREDGAFSAPDGTPYTFDTAQVIRGFLAVIDEMPQLEGNLRRACDYVAGQITSDGRVTTPSYAMWQVSAGNQFSSYTDLYVLPPLLAAAKRLSEPKYKEAALRALESFKRQKDLVEFKPNIGTLSHIFGYMMEALVDLGEADLARKGLRQAAAIQKSTGAIPAYPGVEWVCSPGMAQLALAWYKLGEPEPADRAVAYLESIQNPSGGFYGSYGAGAQYLPKEEISWAVKFFLDCFIVTKRL
jgi:malonyl-CoA O-methyltransferase